MTARGQRGKRHDDGKGDQRIRRIRDRREEIETVGAEPEEHGVAEGDEAGDADQEIEAHHQDRQHHDAGRELHPVDAGELRQQERRDEEKRKQNDDGPAGKLQHVMPARTGRPAAPPARPPSGHRP